MPLGMKLLIVQHNAFYFKYIDICSLVIILLHIKWHWKCCIFQNSLILSVSGCHLHKRLVPWIYYCMIANLYPILYLLVKTYTILEYLNVNKRLSFFRLWPSQKKRNNPSNVGYIIFCNVRSKPSYPMKSQRGHFIFFLFFNIFKSWLCHLI